VGWRATIKPERHVRLRVLMGWRTTEKLVTEGGVYRCGGGHLLLNLWGE